MNIILFSTCGCWPPSGPPVAKKVIFFWFLCGCWPPSGPPAAKSQVFLIFRLLLNAFWHAETMRLVESFRNHHSKVKKVHGTSSYGQNIPKTETWSQCCVLLLDRTSLSGGLLYRRAHGWSWPNFFIGSNRTFINTISTNNSTIAFVLLIIMHTTMHM